MDENKLSAGGFFGGVASSIADSALLQGRTSESFVNAVRAINAKPIKLPEYYIDHYKIQSLQELGESSKTRMFLFGSIFGSLRIRKGGMLPQTGLSTLKKPFMTSILLYQDSPCSLQTTSPKQKLP